MTADFLPDLRHASADTFQSNQYLYESEEHRSDVLGLSNVLVVNPLQLRLIRCRLWPSPEILGLLTRLRFFGFGRSNDGARVQFAEQGRRLAAFK